jgi:hypothetical protein
LFGHDLSPRTGAHFSGSCANLADAQFSTKPYKSVPHEARRAGRRLNNADHSARTKSRVPQHFQAAKTSLGVKEMTICDEVGIEGRSGLSRKMRIVLFFLVEGVAALLVGFVALFLSFEPVWSAESLQAAFLKPGDARPGSPLSRPTKVMPIRRGRYHMSISRYQGLTIRARVTQIFRNRPGTAEAVYVYPLPAGGANATRPKMVIGDAPWSARWRRNGPRSMSRRSRTARRRR